MKKMNIPLMATLLVLSIIVCPILYFTLGPTLDSTQLETLKVLGIIVACSAAFCFIVGEATGNNSQMDKLWSIIGALLLIVLFQGSSSLAEEISSGKYPEYEKYCQSIPRFFPGRKKALS